MRIIAGQYGGRLISSPPGHRTHPMSEKARGGLFSVLGDITSLDVLDAFAGSGAIALEASSRGAADVLALDSDHTAYQTIRHNQQQLSVRTGFQVTRISADSWSKANPDKLFDLVICDPPYNDVKEALLGRLSHHVKLQGLLILSLPTGMQIALPDSFQNVAEKDYGDAHIVFYRRVS